MEESSKNVNISKVPVIRGRWAMCVWEVLCATPGDWSTSPGEPGLGMRNGLTPGLVTWRQYMSFAVPYTDLFGDPVQIT